MVRLSSLIITTKNSPLNFKRSLNSLTHISARFGVFELSENSVRGSGMNSGGESAAMSYQDVLLGIKKQRTRVTLRHRIVPITAAYELLGST